MSGSPPEGAPDKGASLPGLEPEHLSKWLLDRFPNFVSPLGFTRIGDGQSALSYRVDDQAGHRLVLRRPPIGDLVESAHDMVREHGIMTCLERVYAKAPITAGLCTDEDVTGAPFYVMEFVDGLTINRSAIADSLTPAARAAAGVSLVESLNDLQRVDIDGAGLGHLRRPTSFVERQLKRWMRQWTTQQTRDVPEVEELTSRFQTVVPPESETVIVHGDFGIHNVIVADDGQVRVLLDWELCTVGDPLADLGQMLAYWAENGPAAGHADSVFREPVTDRPGFATGSELAALYAETSDRDVSRLGYWVALAYWKMAIIVEGVYRRWLDNSTNGSGAQGLIAAVPRLAALASEALDSMG